MAKIISLQATSFDKGALSRGNEKVFRIFFEHYFHILYRKIYSRVLDEKVTDDLVQEVFIAIWSSRHKLDEIQDLEAYLFGIAKNQLYNYFRKNRNQLVKAESHLESVNDKYYAGETPEADLRTKEALSGIAQVVQLMPDTMRNCYQLFYEEGLSVREICGQLNLSEQTVKNNLSMAKNRIKQFMLNLPTMIFVLHSFLD